jgi:hypothetical protein
MRKYSDVDGRDRGRAPDYRAVFSTLREIITHFMTGHVGPLISPYILAARKILTDLGQAIRKNVADFSNMFKRSSDQRHPSRTSDTRRQTPDIDIPEKMVRVGLEKFGVYPPSSLVSSPHSPSPANPYEPDLGRPEWGSPPHGAVHESSKSSNTFPHPHLKESRDYSWLNLSVPSRGIC